MRRLTPAGVGQPGYKEEKSPPHNTLLKRLNSALGTVKYRVLSPRKELRQQLKVTSPNAKSGGTPYLSHHLTDKAKAQRFREMETLNSTKGSSAQILGSRLASGALTRVKTQPCGLYVSSLVSYVMGTVQWVSFDICLTNSRQHPKVHPYPSH